MGWAVGYDGNTRRFVGYGVPAICEHPDCTEEIDRGLACCCGDMHFDGCGRYFCGKHLYWNGQSEDGPNWSCERCKLDQEPFPLKPDTEEWITHQMTDPSWAQWREENGISA